MPMISLPVLYRPTSHWLVIADNEVVGIEVKACCILINVAGDTPSAVFRYFILPASVTMVSPSRCLKLPKGSISKNLSLGRPEKPGYIDVVVSEGMSNAARTTNMSLPSALNTVKNFLVITAFYQMLSIEAVPTAIPDPMTAPATISPG